MRGNVHEAAFVAVFDGVVNEVAQDLTDGGSIGRDGRQCIWDVGDEQTALGAGTKLHIVGDAIVDMADGIFGKP